MPRPCSSSSSFGRVNGGSCGAATRQEPKTSSICSWSRKVRSTLGGKFESGGGQWRSPSSATSYSWLDPGSRSSIATSA